MAEKKTAIEKEWESFLRREKKLLRKYGRRKESHPGSGPAVFGDGDIGRDRAGWAD